MRKSMLLAIAMAACCCPAVAQTQNKAKAKTTRIVAYSRTPISQTFAKGERLLDFGIGAGTMKYRPKDNGATFTQHIGMEWGVKDGLFGGKASIGVGFIIANSWGGKYTGKAVGTYDYKYNIFRYYASYVSGGKRHPAHTDQVNTGTRNGFGTADADMARDDIKAMAAASFHYEAVKNLDLYATLGLGVGLMCPTQGNYRNAEGIEKKNYRGNTVTIGGCDTYTFYSYNDYDHVKWNDKPDSKVAPAFAFYAGARYYFTPKWAATMQLGLTGSTLKKSYGHGLDIFSVGATYKF